MTEQNQHNANNLYETGTWSPEKVTTQRTLEALRHVSSMDAKDVKLRFHELLMSPKRAVAELWQALESLPERNYALAEQMVRDGLFKDAVFRLKITLWLAPEMQLAHYLLGSCYYAMEKLDLAMQSFKRSYKLNPRHVETHYMLASLDERILPEAVRPHTMPDSLAQGYFNSIAEDYDVSQQQRGYTAHVMADEAVRRHIDVNQINYRLLDLGCGTGLVGGLLDDVMGHITGVDFSREMLEFATQRKRKDGRTIYDRALLRDLRAFLAGIDAAHYDIITMVHVANYVGNLDAVFTGVMNALRPGGVFLLQTEPYKGAYPYGIIPKLGRFGHTEAYVRENAARVGLVIASKEDFRVYPDYTMQQYVMRKPMPRPAVMPAPAAPSTPPPATPAV